MIRGESIEDFFNRVSDRLWKRGTSWHCLEVAKILYKRAVLLEGTKRTNMIGVARAWRKRAELMALVEREERQENE